jgi:hypothetical protein
MRDAHARTHAPLRLWVEHMQVDAGLQSLHSSAQRAARAVEQLHTEKTAHERERALLRESLQVSGGLGWGSELWVGAAVHLCKAADSHDRLCMGVEGVHWWRVAGQAARGDGAEGAPREGGCGWPVARGLCGGESRTGLLLLHRTGVS